MADIKMVVIVENVAPLPKPEVFVGLDIDSDDMVTETELVAAEEADLMRYEATVSAAAGKRLWRVVVHAAAGSLFTAKITVGGKTTRGSGTVGLSKMGLLGGEVTIA